MPAQLLQGPERLQAYAEWLKKAQNGSLWQSLEWKGYQEALGRQTRLYGQFGADGKLAATALVVIDTTVFGLATWDIPRGPVWTEKEAAYELLQTILHDAKKEKCMALTYSPAVSLSATGNHDSRLRSRNSLRHEQPEATLIIDLTKSDEELLANMKQKGRYNIGIAVKKEMVIEESNDIDSFYTLVRGTGKRDAFGVQNKAHYMHFLQDIPGSFLLLAYHTADTTKKPVAGLMGVIWHDYGAYYYGASNYAYRADMAPYLLQWKAMHFCRNKGCRTYDLFGIAPDDNEHHPWVGVTRFKKQFGGEAVLYPKEQEIRLRPAAKMLIELKRRLLG